MVKFHIFLLLLLGWIFQSGSQAVCRPSDSNNLAFDSPGTPTLEQLPPSIFLPYVIIPNTQRIARMSTLRPAWAQPMADMDGDGIANLWAATGALNGRQSYGGVPTPPGPISFSAAARPNLASLSWGTLYSGSTHLDISAWERALLPKATDYFHDLWRYSNVYPPYSRTSGTTPAITTYYAWPRAGVTMPTGWGTLTTNPTTQIISYALPSTTPLPLGGTAPLIAEAAVGLVYTPPNKDDLPLLLRPEADLDGNGMSNWKQFLATHPVSSITEVRGTRGFVAPVPDRMYDYVNWVGSVVRNCVQAINVYDPDVDAHDMLGQYTVENWRTELFYEYDLLRAADITQDANGEMAAANGANWNADIAFWASVAAQPSGHYGPLNNHSGHHDYQTEANPNSFPPCLWPQADWNGDGITNQMEFNAFRTAHPGTYEIGRHTDVNGVMMSKATLSWGPEHYWQWAVGYILLQKGQLGTSRNLAQVAATGPATAQALPTNTDVPAVPNSVDVEYIRGSDMGGGVGGLLYSKRWVGGAWVRKYDLENNRGDVTTQTDASGAVTWQAAYEAFGMRTAESGTNADPQRGNTKDEDPTGLSNQGHRYLDMETGVFLSRDPLGFVDGPNVYCYVRQNPWSKFDPNGLSEDDPSFLDYCGMAVSGFFEGVGDTAVSIVKGIVKVGEPIGELAANLVNDPAAVGQALVDQVNEVISDAKLVGEGVMDAQVLRHAVEEHVGELTQKVENIKTEVARFVEKPGEVALEKIDNVMTSVTPTQIGEATGGLIVALTVERFMPCKWNFFDDTCFVAGTLVWTANGPVAIETITPGTAVLTYDLEGQAWRTQIVVDTFERVSYKGVIEMQVEGESWKCTPDHPFWVLSGENLLQRPIVDHIPAIEAHYLGKDGGRWVDAKDLRIGDRLLSNSEVNKTTDAVTVVGLRVIPGAIPVYNLKVPQDHNYIVGQVGVLVHNANYSRGPKNLLKEASDALAAKAAKEARELQRKKQVKTGADKLGKSNQVVKGDHNTKKGGSDKHDKRIERAKREQSETKFLPKRKR